MINKNENCVFDIRQMTTTTVEIYIFLYFLLLDKAAEGSKKRSFVWDGGGCDSYRLNGKIEIVWERNES